MRVERIIALSITVNNSTCEMDMFGALLKQSEEVQRSMQERKLNIEERKIIETKEQMSAEDREGRRHEFEEE